ncbi:SDR family oxidoreductase [Rhodopirellula sp. JC740]|uniref:SDR family oxidoreductase n=1 Tax=Rhodopirellula halodulae TaxID=2894198 RepID=A0ABS8NJ94_9BACT|nr:NAD(P)-binding oxidoreductase [Rhodopirellula sp. JC740]MCC9642868.1 SDR family oxidoreductase [Rhodopirellula sp. JC740]
MAQVFVAGGTGNTGHLLLGELLSRGHRVVTVVRSVERLRERLGDFDESRCTIVNGSLLDLSAERLRDHVQGCDAIASCLGHNLTFRGMYGHPRRLVTDAVRRLCQTVRELRPELPVRFVLMSSSGVRNADLNEKHTLAERVAFGMLRTLVPPHVDNELATKVLQTEIGDDDPLIHWATVRPDALHDLERVTEYRLEPSPIRSPLFNSGKSSRRNVAHFIAELVTDDKAWAAWRSQTPVLYDRD